MVISPLVGAALIAGLGISAGVKAGLVITLALAATTVLIVSKINVPVFAGEAANIRGVWRSFHTALKRLLISDIFIRTCEGMADIFVILYVTNILGVSVAGYGILVAIQMITSILVYIPSGRIADRTGRKPFVIATFICFALFPISVVLASGFGSLVIAFVIGGLREIGEPSRKAIIIDLSRAEPHDHTGGGHWRAALGDHAGGSVYRSRSGRNDGRDRLCYDS